jgi:hypothetical protein
MALRFKAKQEASDNLNAATPSRSVSEGSIQVLYGVNKIIAPNKI